MTEALPPSVPEDSGDEEETIGEVLDLLHEATYGCESRVVQRSLSTRPGSNKARAKSLKRRRTRRTIRDQAANRADDICEDIPDGARLAHPIIETESQPVNAHIIDDDPPGVKIALSDRKGHEAYLNLTHTEVSSIASENAESLQPLILTTTDTLESIATERSEEEKFETLKRQHQDCRSLKASLTIRQRYRRYLADTDTQLDFFTFQRRRQVNCCRQCWAVIKQNITTALSYLDLWAGSFKDIEGRFGSGISSFFRLLRFLLFLNLAISVILIGLVIVPQAAFKPTKFSESIAGEHCTAKNSTFLSAELKSSKNASVGSVASCHYENKAIGCTGEYNTYITNITTGDSANVGSYILDFLQGTGFFETTLIFYGAYFNKTIDATGLGIDEKSVPYNMPLAYILACTLYLLLSLVLMVYNSAEGFKDIIVSSEDKYYEFSNKVFAAWDCAIKEAKAANRLRKLIETQFEKLLQGEKEKKRRESRTHLTLFALFVIRVFVNLLVVGLIVGSFFAIFQIQQYSLKTLTCNAVSLESNRILALIIQFLPSLVITALNILVPLICVILVEFEDYSPGFALNITMARTFFLRLATIAILVIALVPQITTCGRDMSCETTVLEVGKQRCGNCWEQIKCWETYVGQQMYKLVILDFLVLIASVFFVDFPRKFIFKHFKHRSRLIENFAQPSFELSKNVLDVVYAQTLCWLGGFFGPVIPIICTFKCFLHFYLKKLTLIYNCARGKEIYVSRMNSFFMIALLASFSLVCIPIGYAIARIPPSQSCGPFRIYSKEDFYMYSAVTDFISTTPLGVREVIRIVVSPIFAGPAALFFLLLIYYYYTIAFGQKKRVIQLKAQIRMAGHNKRHLLDRVSNAWNHKLVDHTDVDNVLDINATVDRPRKRR